MKKLKVILSILGVVILLVGCGSNAKEQSSTNETKQEEKQEIKREDNVKKEEKKDNMSKKLEELQPGVFKSKLAQKMNDYKYIPYDDLLRYTNDYIDNQTIIKGTVAQVVTSEKDGAKEVYLHDETSDVYYFTYYYTDIVPHNVLKGDKISVLGKVENIQESTASNALGAETKMTMPLIYAEYILDNSYSEGYSSLSSYLGNDGYKYIPELAGETKDFKDLEDKRGYVFALKSKDDGSYLDKYVFAEKGILRYYTPTVDGKNINGEEISLDSKVLWGAQ
ncbi:hypothetical protein CSBG_03076 [Clostridium sp. 7_2_43FAA]|uniref:hypothetical protein n=1 Tax=Clostridium TaxID=1485 RepID=UPI00019B08D7|nr:MULTISPECIES: hypothetical protein [Clostridium]EEH99450.1 hypothetical protein CSBG_03076 [Clostridium sp. 7_2_43FAA]